MNLKVFIPCVPVAQPRTKATIRGKHAGVYTPKGPHDAFKAEVALAVGRAWDSPPVAEPVRVDVLFLFPRTKGQMWKRKPMPRLHHTKKPDRDNLDKAVLDALKGIVWIDDSQVCQGQLNKWIAAGDEQPGVELTITILDQ